MPSSSSTVTTTSSDVEGEDVSYNIVESDLSKSCSVQTLPCYISMQFHHMTCESDVRFFTGFESSQMFITVFDFVKIKASIMTYWDGCKKTLLPDRTPTELTNLLASPEYNVLPLKNGPNRKLSLEQEFLLTMMRFRLGLLTDDLAFRFQVSSGKVSQILITWIKLLGKELSCLIVWPSKSRVTATLPYCFKKLYPKTRTIIDCTDIFMDTPSSLEVQALLWSDYKSHCTVKFLIAVSPNGATTWISPLYGGRTSDIYIVRKK